MKCEMRVARAEIDELASGADDEAEMEMEMKMKMKMLMDAHAA